MGRAALRRLLKPLIGVSLFGWLLAQLEWVDLVALFARPDRGTLYLGAASLLLSFSLMQPLRLHSLLADYTGGFGGSYRLFAIGALFNTLLPSNVGGDAVRLVYLVRARPGNWGAPLSLLVLQRASQLVTLLIVGAGCALVDLPRLSDLLGALGGPRPVGDTGATVAVLLTLATFGAVILMRFTSTGARLSRRVETLTAEARQALGELGPAALLSLLVYTFGFHALRVVGFVWLCRFVGFEVAWHDIVLVLCLTAVAALLPITVGGLGVMEGAIVGGLLLFGVAPTAATAVALVNRASLLPSAVAGAIVYAADRDKIALATVEKPHTA